MELDLPRSFRLLCTAVLIGWDPATPPSPRIWARIRRRYWSAKVDIHLFVIPWDGGSLSELSWLPRITIIPNRSGLLCVWMFGRKLKRTIVYCSHQFTINSFTWKAVRFGSKSCFQPYLQFIIITSVADPWHSGVYPDLDPRIHASD